jgi:acyl-CoA thioester hydrolase
MSVRLGLKDFLKKYPVVSKITLKWGDMDAYQHVNNCMYFKYQEVARLRYFSFLLNHIDPKEFDIKKFSNGTGIGPIMSDTYCNFKLPLTVPDKILVGSTILEGDLTKDRYKLSHQIWSLKHNRIVADGFGTVVSYDFKNQTACDIPLAMVHSINKVQALDSLHLHDSIVANALDVEDEF